VDGVRALKVFMVHNSYQVRGGEDSVFENECLMLQDVLELDTYVANNDTIGGIFSKFLASVNVFFSVFTFFNFLKYFKKSSPEIVHVHNYFPIISPALFYACKFSGVPVVHTLHNFRAICPTATLMYDGVVNETSMKKGSFWTVPKKVYRDSYLGTAVLAFATEFHKRMGTWRYAVDGYIALTQFSKDKYIEAGWPADKIFIKPNFVTDPGEVSNNREKYVLFVGRLGDEKGIDFLLNTFSKSDFSLKIAGDGPLLDLVKNHQSSNIEYLGRLSKEDISARMKKASCLVMASTWYEGFPMVIVEAMAHGLPIVVPNLGNMASVVQQGINGLHYEPKNADDLLASVAAIIEDKEKSAQLSLGARSTYLENYTEDINRAQLLDIYKQVIARKELES
jgi:glycosyltransferase involved in cell wall biosynthesis